MAANSVGANAGVGYSSAWWRVYVERTQVLVVQWETVEVMCRRQEYGSPFRTYRKRTRSTTFDFDSLPVRECHYGPSPYTF